MTFLRHSALVAAAGAAFLIAGSANAATLLTYDFTGQPGNQTSTAAASVATGLGGVAITRSSGLTPSGAANSMSSSGWTTSQFYTFGLTVLSGYTASVNQLLLNTRSSGTGPGFLAVQASVDGGAFATIATLAQGNATDDVQTLNFAALNALSSITFRITPTSTVSASGATVASGGTFRLEDYNYVSAANPGTAMSINGLVSAITAVPEPGTWAMMIVGFGVVGAAMRGRRKVAVRFA